jgi:hypothetical protein
MALLGRMQLARGAGVQNQIELGKIKPKPLKSLPGVQTWAPSPA